MDGGSENANQSLLGMLEFLVYKRLIKTIHFTRLPTGHTHEDIGTEYVYTPFINNDSLLSLINVF